MDLVVEYAEHVLKTPLDFFFEHCHGLILGQTELHPVFQIVDVTPLGQLRHSCRQHHQEHLNQNVAIVTNYLVCLTTQFLEGFKVLI